VAKETSGDRSVERPARRRLLRIAAVAGVALILYALSGFLLIPRLVRWAIQEKGGAAIHREVTLREVGFNPFTLELNLTGLRIRDRDRQPLLSLDRLHLELALSGIVRRAWQLRTLRVEGLIVRLRVLRDGKLGIADLLLGNASSAALPRLIIGRFAIRDGKVELIDESVTPPVAASLAPVTAEVRDLITLPEQRGEHALSIRFGTGATKSSIRMTGQQTLSPLGLSGRIEARNIALPSLAQWLAPDTPIVLRGGQCDAGAEYHVRRGNRGGLQLEATGAGLTATSLALSPRGQSGGQLAIPRFEVRDAKIAFPLRQVEIGSMRISDPRGSMGWNPQGRLDWTSESGVPPVRRPSSAEPPAAERWSVTLGKMTIERGALHIEDQQTATPVRLDLDGMTIEATGISNNATTPIALSATATANGGGRISVRGALVPSPFSLDTQSSLSAIDLIPFRPYAASIMASIWPGATSVSMGECSSRRSSRF
jgi:uncharacterized protein involved in outer membrane biogenesis